MNNNHKLIDGVRSRPEIAVNELRSYEDPPPVKVFNLKGELIRIDPPTVFVNPSFNNRKRGNEK
jgi:hypothetical protein